VLTEEITFDDYNGDSQTETVHFQLSKSDLIDMEMNTAGGMENALKEVIKSKDNALIYQKFKWMMSKAYGVKTDDGRYFRKRPELWDDFTETPVYDAIMVRLFSDAEYAAKFFAGMMPSDMVDKLPELGSFVDATDSEPAQTEVNLNADKPKKLMDMTREELIEAMRLRNDEQNAVKQAG
jgi:hypothetical protein